MKSVIRADSKFKNLRDTQAGRVVTLARRTQFSCAHLYSQAKWSDEKNREIFGACFSKYGHGHNYTAEVFLTGKIDSHTGLVVNLLDTDKLLRNVVAPLEHHHLNFDVPYFKNVIPTTEEIAKYIFQSLCTHLQAAQNPFALKIEMLRLYETDDIWTEVAATAEVSSQISTSFTKSYIFHALHNLENPDSSVEENERLYGMCFRKHGHHYQVLVTLQDQSSDQRGMNGSGMCVSRDELDAIVTEEILAPYEGVFLNDYFANTSGEALACYFFETLNRRLGEKLQKVAIQETRKNYFELTREQFELKRLSTP